MSQLWRTRGESPPTHRRNPAGPGHQEPIREDPDSGPEGNRAPGKPTHGASATRGPGVVPPDKRC
jgi:hypothetical protein